MQLTGLAGLEVLRGSLWFQNTRKPGKYLIFAMEEARDDIFCALTLTEEEEKDY